MDEIKLIILDIDGVLTDGKKYYDRTGKVLLKTFCDKDWTVLKIFKALNIEVVCITGDPFNSFIEKNRNISVIVNRSEKKHLDKGLYLDRLLKKFKLTSEQVCFVGDDIFDVGLMKKVKYSFCPNDSPNIVKKECKVLKSNGGNNLMVSLMEELIRLKLIKNIEYDSIISKLYMLDEKEIF